MVHLVSSNGTISGTGFSQRRKRRGDLRLLPVAPTGATPDAQVAYPGQNKYPLPVIISEPKSTFTPLAIEIIPPNPNDPDLVKLLHESSSRIAALCKAAGLAYCFWQHPDHPRDGKATIINDTGGSLYVELQQASRSTTLRIRHTKDSALLYYLMGDGDTLLTKVAACKETEGRGACLPEDGPRLPDILQRFAAHVVTLR